MSDAWKLGKMDKYVEAVHVGVVRPSKLLALSLFLTSYGAATASEEF